MPALRARSIALTGYLEQRLAPLGRLGVEVITPREPARRGAQLSLRFGSASAADAVLARLAADGVVADFRAPDIIRLAPVPLYNTYHEAWRVAEVLRSRPCERFGLEPDPRRRSRSNMWTVSTKRTCLVW